MAQALQATEGKEGLEAPLTSARVVTTMDSVVRRATWPHFVDRAGADGTLPLAADGLGGL